MSELALSFFRLKRFRLYDDWFLVCPVLKALQPDSQVVLDGIVLKDGLDPHLNQISPKENTVGSLSFTVTDSSSSEMILKARKPITRTKVPFEKGYSQMDWLKLTRTHPDLAGKRPFSSFP